MLQLLRSFAAIAVLPDLRYSFVNLEALRGPRPENVVLHQVNF